MYVCTFIWVRFLRHLHWGDPNCSAWSAFVWPDSWTKKIGSSGTTQTYRLSGRDPCMDQIWVRDGSSRTHANVFRVLPPSSMAQLSIKGIHVRPCL
jgi:hypothetical protein